MTFENRLQAAEMAAGAVDPERDARRRVAVAWANEAFSRPHFPSGPLVPPTVEEYRAASETMKNFYNLFGLRPAGIEAAPATISWNRPLDS